jgi:type II secretory pathway pseudopilin PulG
MNCPAKPQEGSVIKYGIAVIGILALAATPALAVGGNCADQLAQVKAQLSSEMLAQSATANKYREAERLCTAGQDEQAQALAQQLREQMAQKGTAGSSDAPATAGGSAKSTGGQSK